MNRRNAVTLVLLFIGLCALVVVSIVDSQHTADATSPYAPESSTPNGTLALFDWMKAIGYRSERRGVLTGGLPSAKSVVLVLPSPQKRDDAWADDLLQWVRGGGTLIVLRNTDTTNNIGSFGNGDDNSNSVEPLLNVLDVELRNKYFDVSTLTVDQALPGADRPPEYNLGRRQTLSTSRDHIVHVSADGSPVLISMKEGDGTVFVTTLDDLFVNDGLHNDNNARWVRAMIGTVPPGSAVVFDQTRVTVDFADQPSFNKLLFSTPWGWALLFAAAAIVGYVILNGRRFGCVLLPRAEALAAEGLGQRRDPAEYVVSTAGLFERAGRRGMALSHLHRRAKRALGRRWQINPTLPDDTFVDVLRRSRDDIDRETTLRLLQSLDPERAGNITDRDLLNRARAVAKFIADYTRK